MRVDDQAGGQGSARRSLDRDQIVEAALAHIDRYGAQGLTMRGLGQELGVEAMALYRHVSGREDLLEAVVASLLAGITSDLDTQLSQTWQGYLQTLAHAIRRIATDHPATFPLVATRHPAAPWLRPPLRSLEMVEHFLIAMRGHGFTDEQVVAIYRSFSSFLLGHLLLESAARGAETSPVDQPLDEGGADVPNQDGQVDLSTVPEVARLRPLLSVDHSEEEFEVALETLLDRLELSIAQ